MIGVGGGVGGWSIVYDDDLGDFLNLNHFTALLMRHQFVEGFVIVWSRFSSLELQGNSARSSINPANFRQTNLNETRKKKKKTCH